MTSPVKRIVLIDDHDAVRRGVKALVETRPNYIVVGEANDGRAACDEVRRRSPDIVITDHSLPGLNGVELTLELKRQFPRLEILIYTMHERESVILAALRAGARGYVLKSDSEQHLLAALDSLSIRRPYFSGVVSEALLGRFLSSARDEYDTILTPRERQIVQLIAEGKINKQIAAILNISVKTVETHRSSAMHKLTLNSTADLVRYAIRNNLIEP